MMRMPLITDTRLSGGWGDDANALESSACLHVDHGHSRQPAESHLRRDARERCARAAPVLRGLPLQPLDRRQCRSMARRGVAVRHRAAVYLHQPRELEADWMHGAAVYVDRIATYCTATHPRSLTGA